MNKAHLVGAIFAAMLASHSTNAGTVVRADPHPVVYGEDGFTVVGGGIQYLWSVELGPSDLGQFSNHVGAWSWDEDSFVGTDKGWTHTSNWVALTLTAATQLTIRLENKGDVPLPSPGNPNGLAGNNLFPGLTIWSAWETDGGDFDTYNNRGNVAWAEDITYLDHIEGGFEHWIERTWMLPAGNYTVALGGNSPSTSAEGRQGYLATFTTSVVPEPGTAVLLGMAAMLLVGRRAGCWRSVD